MQDFILNWCKSSDATLNRDRLRDLRQRGYTSSVAAVNLFNTRQPIKIIKNYSDFTLCQESVSGIFLFSIIKTGIPTLYHFLTV
jgi:hypothetical protein